MQIYVIQRSDTVDKIAHKFGVDVGEMIYINQLFYPYALAIGQALLIPTKSKGRPTKKVISGGYAYPFIMDYVLEETLPFLTEIYIFSYGFTEEGKLIPPQASPERILEGAKKKGVDAILTLTPLGPDGRFSNELIHKIVNDEEAKQCLINELLVVIPLKGYQGLDIDFEYIMEKDRDAFTAFVAEVTERMNQEGWRVSVALAPKTSADQPGLLYSGKDYAGLGRAANQVLLMTYEWGYTYGPPMAVAPINQVRRVLNYAITEIPHNKISMGIPNYGYDWPLPFVSGETKARTIGNVEAVQLAIKYGAEILFDEVAKSPYFYYTAEGVDHVVWFEDVRSMYAKFELVNEYDFLGMVYWQLMKLFLANWYLLEDKFIIR